MTIFSNSIGQFEKGTGKIPIIILHYRYLFKHRLMLDRFRGLVSWSCKLHEKIWQYTYYYSIKFYRTTEGSSTFILWLFIISRDPYHISIRDFVIHMLLVYLCSQFHVNIKYLYCITPPATAKNWPVEINNKHHYFFNKNLNVFYVIQYTCHPQHIIYSQFPI